MRDVSLSNAQPQRILVLQQGRSGESKIQGIRFRGGDRFLLQTLSLAEALPAVLDETDAYLPAGIDADLVLDFLKHPDLSYDLALRCRDQGVPLIASGKRHRIKGAFTPPT